MFGFSGIGWVQCGLLLCKGSPPPTDAILTSCSHHHLPGAEFKRFAYGIEALLTFYRDRKGGSDMTESYPGQLLDKKIEILDHWDEFVAQEPDMVESLRRMENPTDLEVFRALVRSFVEP
jgi:hypothetical protein